VRNSLLLARPWVHSTCHGCMSDWESFHTRAGIPTLPLRKDMKKRKQKASTGRIESYILSRVGEPNNGKFNPLYLATVRGVQFAVGQFATVEEAVAVADANLADYLTRIDPKPAYRVEEIGTVTVDTGTIIILDPARIGDIAATQNHDNLVSSPLYPDGSLKPGQRVDENPLARQILDPEVPAKENPKEIKDYGTSAGNALSLETGLGDGEYSVIAEIVNFGEPLRQRIAAIHIQFLGDEDIEAAKKQAKAARNQLVTPGIGVVGGPTNKSNMGEE